VQQAEIRRLVEAQSDYVVRTRRLLHQHPELSLHERETAALVAAELRGCGIEPQEGFGGGHGVVATLAGALPGPSIALRADMDALPVEELNDLPFRSQNAGVMHACGHDAHTAVLLAAARVLAAQRHRLPGRVRFLFQPAEELPPGGALGMIEAGCLDGIDAVFGLHQRTQADAGRMLFIPGPYNASSDSFTLTVLGKGGHAARPHVTVDAIQIAGQMISALHQIVSRRVPPQETAVLTIGTVQGGTKNNVVAHEVTLGGTVRTWNPGVRRVMPRQIEAVAKGVTGAWGATYRLQYDLGYPVLVNDAAMTDLARRAAVLALGAGSVAVTSERSMGGEDFAHYLQKVPGCFAMLGAGTPGSKARISSHSGAFVLDEAALPAGVAWYLALAFNFAALRAGDTGHT